MMHKRSSSSSSSSSSSTVSSAAIIGANDELLIRIFIFLPPKSLIKLKLLSKRCCSIISSPSFSRLHRRLRDPPHLLLLTTHPFKYSICHPSTKTLSKMNFGRIPPSKILQSCNGLLLLEREGIHEFEHEDYKYPKRIYTVFNPATMQSRILTVRRSPVRLLLLFDPCESPHYKAVCFDSRDCSKPEFHLSVYDSQTKKWNQKGTSGIYPGGNDMEFDPIYWNGAIYWRSKLGLGLGLGLGLSRFSLDGDGGFQFQEMELPAVGPSVRGEGREYLVESNGHLHYVVFSMQAEAKRLIVHEMRRDGDGWFVRYDEDFSRMWEEICRREMWWWRCAVGLIRGECEEDLMTICWHGEVMIYRFLDRVFEVFELKEGEEGAKLSTYWRSNPLIIDGLASV